MSDDASKDDVTDSHARTETGASSHGGSDRRRFFEIASLALGAIVSLGPALIGLIAFIDPLRRKKSKPIARRENGADGGDGLIRVASLEALTVGRPKRFPVIDDQLDAWNFTPDQPIGSVFVEKLANGDVRVFNTTCPHAGCSVAFNGDAFLCPCHNSSFETDGKKLVSESGRENPSPRDLDSLKHEVKGGEIWIEFKNFYTGKHDKKEKA